VINQLSLTRVNRIASLSIIPVMLLAIAAFSRVARPEAAAVPPASGTIVVANLRAESLTFIDLATGGTAELVLPGPPHEMVEAAGRIYVTLGRGNALVEIEPAGPAILRTLDLPGEPHGLALQGDNLLVTLDRSHELVVVDRGNLSVERRTRTGNTPHVVAVSGEDAFVTGSREDTVWRIGRGQTVSPAGALPEGIAVVGERVVVANAMSGNVTVYSAADLSTERTIAVGAGPVRVMALDGDRAVVALQAASEFVEIDLVSGKVLRRIKVAEGRPDGLCAPGTGGFVAVATNADRKLTVFVRDGWKRAATFAAGEGPGACLWLETTFPR